MSAWVRQFATTGVLGLALMARSGSSAAAEVEATAQFQPLSPHPASNANRRLFAGKGSAGLFTAKGGLALGIVGTTYVASWCFVSAAWWSNQGSEAEFRFRDEGAFGAHTYAGGADKLGHFYSNYLATRVYTDILQWGGLSRAVSMVSATLLTTAFFTAVEIKDAYVPDYGFSAGDIVSNLAGQVAALGMMLAPALDEAVSIKLMYFPSKDFIRAIPKKGAYNMPEDYSGQTYLLALHLSGWVPLTWQRIVPALRALDVSVGYATRGYEPIPQTPRPVSQLVSLGLSINAQRLFDDWLDTPTAGRSTGASVVHFVNEVVQPPLTRAAVLTYQRWAPPAAGSHQ